MFIKQNSNLISFHNALRFEAVGSPSKLPSQASEIIGFKMEPLDLKLTKNQSLTYKKYVLCTIISCLLTIEILADASYRVFKNSSFKNNRSFKCLCSVAARS